VVAGDSVSEGSPIGQVGTDSPQVKVELRQNGQPVDITSLIG
jgi:septal ring factor EnvC (AmiA/AmiB activator)